MTDFSLPNEQRRWHDVDHRSSAMILNRLRDPAAGHLQGKILGGSMSPDGVTTAFEMILEEIDSVVSEVNSQGAAFLRNNEYQQAKDAITAGEKLAAFRQKLESLKDEWVIGQDEPTRRQVNIEPAEVAKTIASAPKSSKAGQGCPTSVLETLIQLKSTALPLWSQMAKG